MNYQNGYRGFAGPFLPFIGGVLVGGLFAPNKGPVYPPQGPYPYPSGPTMPAYPPAIYPAPLYGPYPPQTYEQQIYLLNDPTFMSVPPSR